MHRGGIGARSPAHTRFHALSVGLLALLLAASVLTGCGPGAAERRAADPRPNVLLISLDTTRADHLSAYGYWRETSPNLASLAADGILFDVAYAPSATTGPSHASLFTSLYPMSHRVVKNGIPLDERFETLAEVLGANGFDTAAVVSSFVLSRRFGYAQGFGSFDEDFSRAGVPSGTTLWEGREVEGQFYGRADDTTRRALDWLDRREARESPFFLFVHYFDPHDPYLTPPGYQPPFTRGPKEALKLNREIFLYDTLIAFVDREIGRLVAGLRDRGLEDDTLIVVTGDHGEGLMQHGHMFHGAQIYEEDVRVPLIVRWPGRLGGPRVIEQPVETIDVAATLLDWTGVDGGASFRGRSLAELLRDDPGTAKQRRIHLFRRHYEGGEVAPGVEVRGQKFGLRIGRWKLIDGPDEGRVELYDLQSDPGEREDLSAAEPERVAEMRAIVSQWRARHTREAPASGVPSPEDRARLEALGYAD